MKIVKLIAENYKRLSAVEITPDGNMVIISGKNEAGKSSVLDAIEAALCGGRNLPKEPIKQGEHSARVVVETEEYKITRKFLGQNSTLVVETKGEVKSKITSPQAFLDSIIGNISFDPLAFTKKNEQEQRQMVIDFVGLNTNDLDTQIAKLKSDRSEIRKEKEKAEGYAASLIFTPDLPEEECGSTALLEELKIIDSHNAQIAQSHYEKEALTSQLDKEKTTLNETVEEIRRLTEKHRKQLESIATIASAISAIPDAPLMDRESAERALSGLEKTNELIRINKAKKEAERKAEEYRKDYANLGMDLGEVVAKKAQRIAGMTMPIQGLTITEDGLRYNDIPFSQVNDANKLKVSVAIAMAMNPKLKVLRVNGNDLDSDNLKALGEMVADKDYQIWIEKIDDSKKLGFYIEDGTVANTKPAEEQK